MSGSLRDEGLPAANRRRAFRCRLPDADQPITLCGQSESVSGVLLDESAGGFAVVVPKVGFAVGDVVKLETSKGGFQVRVANLRRLDDKGPDAMQLDTQQVVVGDVTEAGRADAAGTDAQETYRVGLELLREISPWEEGEGTSSLFQRLRPSTFLPRRFSMVAAGAVFALLLGLPLVGLLLLGSFNHPLLAWGQQLTSPAKVDPFAGSKRPRWGGSGESTPSTGGDSSATAEQTARREADERTRGSVQSDSGSSSLTTSDGLTGQREPTSASGTGEPAEVLKLRSQIRRAVGAQALLLPEVSQLLGLTRQQRVRIDHIVEISNGELDRLRPDRNDGGDIGRARERVLAAARRAAVEVLTPAQRDAFRRLEGDRAAEVR